MGYQSYSDDRFSEQGLVSEDPAVYQKTGDSFDEFVIILKGLHHKEVNKAKQEVQDGHNKEREWFNCELQKKDRELQKKDRELQEIDEERKKDKDTIRQLIGLLATASNGNIDTDTILNALNEGRENSPDEISFKGGATRLFVYDELQKLERDGADIKGNKDLIKTHLSEKFNLTPKTVSNVVDDYCYGNGNFINRKTQKQVNKENAFRKAIGCRSLLE